MELRNRKVSEEEGAGQNAKGQGGSDNAHTGAVAQPGVDGGTGVAEGAKQTEDSTEFIRNGTAGAVHDLAAANNAPYTETMQVDVEASDAEMSNGDPDDVAGAFLGEFEEIEEDEDVERLISQNHTPSASTRQSPAALRPQSDHTDSLVHLAAAMSSDNESSDDSDDNFESIPELTAASTTAAEQHQAHSAAAGHTSNAHAVSSAPSDAARSETHVLGSRRSSEPQEEHHGEPSTNGLPSVAEAGPTPDAGPNELDVLQERFREKYIPKLAHGLFFDLDVYKRYSVVAAPGKSRTGTNEATKGANATAEKPVLAAAHHKPSSLRVASHATAEANRPVPEPSDPKADIGPSLRRAQVPAEEANVRAVSGSSSDHADTNNAAAPSSSAAPASSVEIPPGMGSTENGSGVPAPLTGEPQPIPKSPDRSRPSGLPTAQLSPRSPSRTSARTKSALSGRDDVVGALLGAMKSPTIGAGQTAIQQQHQQHQQQKQQKKDDEVTDRTPVSTAHAAASQSIPDDMLAAMQAIEGIGSPDSTGFDGPRATAAATHAAGNSPKDLAARLPKGYSGPFSQLTLADHSLYLTQASRLKAGELSAKESTEFQRLKAKVDSEQQKFRAQARESVLPLLTHLNESVNTAVRDQLAKSRDDDTARYPQLYTATKITTIRSISSGYVPLVYKDTLLQRGVCHRANVPAIESEPFVLPPALDPWPTASGSSGRSARYTAMSQDSFAGELVGLAGADVALSASALNALLTLPQAYKQDVIIPFKVVEVAGAKDARPGSSDKEPGVSARRVAVVVDKPLASVQATTPRRLNRMFYSTAVKTQLVDRSKPLELAGGSLAGAIKSRTLLGEGGSSSAAEDSERDDGAPDNLNYTLWEFGGLRVLIRYKVHAFAPTSAAGPDSDSSGGNGGGSHSSRAAHSKTTTVTLKTKLEYQLGQKPLGAGSSGSSGTFEEISESERLSWWMSSYLRGNPSEVWVSHVDVHSSGIVRVSKLKCGDLYSGAASSESGASACPSTRGVLAILQDLLKLPAGQYMLVHKRRTWDATIYRAADSTPGAPLAAAAAAAAQRGRDAVLNLGAELSSMSASSPIQLDIESDFVPGAWQGLPGQIPFTHPPSDLAHFCSSASTWVSRKRRPASSKRKKAKRG
ncbi:hypothetical protein GQ54DRAFT_187656 [Martensiomyces pterosporus]|nr:hypothetical protein GQ54DRAFT_187656 [Martensiomyces pterosporus]